MHPPSCLQDRVSDMVYLTADSPNTLSDLDPSKIYVIGGIVDRNRHKGICYERAQAAGVATAKLPIGDLFKLATSSVSDDGIDSNVTACPLMGCSLYSGGGTSSWECLRCS